MVETAVFGFFHRARSPSTAPAPQTTAPIPAAPVPAAPLPAAHEAAPAEAIAQSIVTQAAAEPRTDPPERLVPSLPPLLVAVAPAEPPSAPRPEPVPAAAVPPVFPQPVFPQYNAAPEPGQPSHAAPPAAVPHAEAATADPEPVDPAPWTSHDAISSAADADQLGLANPDIITLVATLPGFQSVELDASGSGLYRPSDFRPAPWSGFAYDQARNTRTGLAAGTRILTSRGEMEVERLLPGDAALALRGPALLPISWIGKAVAEEAPIRIEAGALGPNLPRRPLCLAPDQAVFLEPQPVTARTLLNGTTIRRVDGGRIDVFHIDVGKPEVLFAEGVPLASGERASPLPRQ